MAILTDIAAGAHRLPRRQRHRAHALRLGRDHQPRLLHALAGLRARLAARRRRSSSLSLVAIMAFGRYATRPAGGDRRDPADLLDQARRSSSSRRCSPTCSPAAPISLDFPELQALQLPGRRLHRQVADRALAGARRFYTASYIAESVRAGIQAVSRGQTEAAARARPPARAGS